MGLTRNLRLLRLQARLRMLPCLSRGAEGDNSMLQTGPSVCLPFKIHFCMPAV